MLPASRRIGTLAVFDLNVREGSRSQIKFRLQFDCRLLRTVGPAATGEFGTLAVRQGDRRTINQRHTRKAFQERRQRVGRSDHDLDRLAKQVFQKLHQLR